MAVTDTNTLLSLMNELAIDLGFYYTGTAQASGSSAAIIKDETIGSPLDSDLLGTDSYRGKWFYISAGTNSGEEARASSSSGTGATATMERPYTAAIDETSVYRVYPFSRADMLQAINDSLARCKHEDWLLVTEVPDGDMRLSTFADWTASGATVSKVTTSTSRIFGNRALRVVNASATNHAISAAAINCKQRQQYFIEAIGRAAVGTADLIIVDGTSGAEIDSIATDEIGADPGTDLFRLRLSFNTGASESFKIKLSGVESSAVIEWNLVGMLPTEGRNFPLPTGIEQGSWVFQNYWLKGEPKAKERRSTQWHDVERIGGPGTALSLRIAEPVDDALLFTRVVMPYAALTLDSDITACPLRWVLAGAMIALLEPLQAISTDYEIKLNRAKRRFLAQSKLHQASLTREPQMSEWF